MTRKRIKDGLKSKVQAIPTFTEQDECRRFIAYCNFERHRGIVLKPHVCEIRKCDYYQKFYIGGKK